MAAYKVHVQTKDPLTGDPLPLPIVSIHQGNFKIAKMYGSDERRMRDVANTICVALELQEIDIRNEVL